MQTFGFSVALPIEPAAFDSHTHIVNNGSNKDGYQHKNKRGLGMVLLDQFPKTNRSHYQHIPGRDCSKSRQNQADEGEKYRRTKGRKKFFHQAPPSKQEGIPFCMFRNVFASTNTA
jgi:hypothetical protein